MPDLLKLQLIDDWENITKDQKVNKYIYIYIYIYIYSWYCILLLR